MDTFNILYLPVDVIIEVVGGLEQLEVHLPNDPDPKHAVVQELVDSLLDLLGWNNRLHHDAVVRLVLENSKA